MGKMMETKETILNKLRERRHTLAELSDELGLAKATVSQHLSELERMGAVHGYEDEHFRRLKYFEAVQGFDMDAVKTGFFNRFGTVIGIIIVLGVLAGVAYYSNTNTYFGQPHLHATVVSNQTTSVQPSVNSTTTVGGSPGIASVLYFSTSCTTNMAGVCYLNQSVTGKVANLQSFRFGVWAASTQNSFAIPIANVTLTITSGGAQVYQHTFPLQYQSSGWTASNVISLPPTSQPLNFSVRLYFTNGGAPISNVIIQAMAESNPSCSGCQ